MVIHLFKGLHKKHYFNNAFIAFCLIYLCGHSTLFMESSFCHESHEAEKEKHGEKHPEPPIIALERMVIPVIQKDVLLGYILLSLVLKFEDGEEKTTVEFHKSRLLHIIFTDLYAVFSTYWLEKTKIEPEWVRKRIQKILSEKFFLKTQWNVELKNLTFTGPRETVLTFN